MTLCSNCGKEVEPGRNFCPFCAHPLAGEGAAPAGALQPSEHRHERYLTEEDLEPPVAIPLASFDERHGETEKSQRKLYAVVAIASLVALAGLAVLFSTDVGRSLLPSSAGAKQERLEGALRPGSPEFDEALSRIVLDFDADEDAGQAARPIGDTVITMKPTIRNFTNRTINGLELRAAGYDLSGQVVRERTLIVIPTRQAELEPNKTFSPSIMIEGFQANNIPASLKIEITGIKFK